LAAPKEIVDLVEKFERNLLEYKSSTYNEAQTRKEFIDPFFKAFGWDIGSSMGDINARILAEIGIIDMLVDCIAFLLIKFLRICPGQSVKNIFLKAESFFARFFYWKLNGIGNRVRTLSV
jgi:hypothetical protein